MMALMVFVSCSIAIAATICGSCGYESADAARFCSHCGASVKAPTRGSTPASKDDVAKTEASMLISPVAVTEDMIRARDYLKQAKVGLARMFCRNALALNLLAGEAPPDVTRSQAILRFLNQCTKAEGLVSRRCPVCEGTGKRVMTASTLSGSTHEVQIGGSRCERCKGSGSIRGGETIDERKYRDSRSAEQYRILQQSYGRLPVGLVWVPGGAVDALKTADRVALKRALPPPCSRCAGIGRADCKTCRGSGSVTCGAKGCEQGLVERKPDRGRLGSRSASGSGKSVPKHKCVVCRGKGLVACEKCVGAGSILCKRCDGGGLAPVCSKCDRSGLVPCRKCLGTRVCRGEPCTYCQEQGVVECSSCGGTGRKR